MCPKEVVDDQSIIILISYFKSNSLNDEKIKLWNDQDYLIIKNFLSCNWHLNG